MPLPSPLPSPPISLTTSNFLLKLRTTQRLPTRNQLRTIPNYSNQIKILWWVAQQFKNITRDSYYTFPEILPISSASPAFSNFSPRSSSDTLDTCLFTALLEPPPGVKLATEMGGMAWLCCKHQGGKANINHTLRHVKQDRTLHWPLRYFSRSRWSTKDDQGWPCHDISPRCIPPMSTDHGKSILLKYSLTWCSSAKGTSSSEPLQKCLSTLNTPGPAETHWYMGTTMPTHQSEAMLFFRLLEFKLVPLPAIPQASA